MIRQDHGFGSLREPHVAGLALFLVASTRATLVICWLSLKQGTGNRGMGMGNGERGTGNGESSKRGIFKSGNL